MRRYRSLRPRFESGPATLIARRWLVCVGIAVLAALVITDCGTGSRPARPPSPAPVETPTPTSTPTPTPEPTPTAEGNEAAAAAANEAEEKARQAAKKAAEAAHAAGEASTAAGEAAKAAAKAVAATKTRRSAHHATPRESPRAVVSPTPMPSEAETPAAETPAAEPSVATSVVSTAGSEQSQKQIDQLQNQVKNIDRAKLGGADAQRYEMATRLLLSARTALSKNDYLAANSLTKKAQLLVEQIGH
jgi:hypothetical protein